MLAAEPDYFVSVQALATDPLISQQYSLAAMNIPLDLPDDLPSVTVAVIDSGICPHPELAGKVLGGYDFVENDSTPQDEAGHGCAVAGIIAANRDGVGMAGVAPNARLLAYRVLNAQGTGRYSSVASAIVRAADDGAQIINLSLGGANSSQILQDAVDYATSRGVLVIAAAGNNGSNTVLYPAAYPNVVSVGALSPDGTQAVFSNRGKVEAWAPGVNVLSLTLSGEYSTYSGTSFAAPNAAGLAALEMAHGRSLGVLTPAEVVADLQAKLDLDNAGGQEVSAQAQLYFGQTQSVCLSEGQVAYHQWYFPTPYWQYIFDNMLSSGNLRYNVHVSGPGVNTVVPSTPPQHQGRVIIYGPDHGGGGAGNYYVSITGVSGSGCVNSTVWSGWRPKTEIAWGWAATHHSLRKWHLTTDQPVFIRFERLEGSGPIQLYVWGPNGQQVVSFATHPEARWAIFNVPFVGGGNYLLEFVAPNGFYRWVFQNGVATINTPLAVSASNITANSMRISWFDNNDNEAGYVLYYRIGSQSWQSGASLGPNATSFTLTNLQCGTRYAVLVRAWNDSYTSDSLIEADTLPCVPAPTLTTPLHMGTVATMRPIFSWTPIPGITSYTLQISHTCSFSRPHVFNVSGNRFALSFDLPPGSWCWRMRSVTVDGHTSAWTEARVLNILQAANTPPMLCAVVSNRLPMAWEEVTQAALYEYQLSRRSDFHSLEIVQQGVVGSATRSLNSAVLPNGRYFYRVRAQDAVTGRWSSWSRVVGCTLIGS